jgi:hypothetical protein
MKAIELAQQFRERAEARDGSIWLSAKQVKFFSSLATWVYSGSKNVRSDVIGETVHGRPSITAYFSDGEVWTCQIAHNGAGSFQRERHLG